MREVTLPRPAAFVESNLAPFGARLFGYATTKDTVRVWYLYRAELDRDEPISGFGRVIDPRHAGYVGVATGRLREKRKASAKVRAAMKGETPKPSWLDRILRWLGVRK
jgi:hypothetical protein